MKKIFVVLCIAFVAAAMAVPAMALDMSIAGFYRVRGFYQSNADMGTITPWKDSQKPATIMGRSGYNSPDAWWDHLLELDPVFKVTDNLKLVTRVSMFNNQIWGSGQTSGGVPASGALRVADFGDTAENVLVNGAYLDWSTSVGRVKIGRMPGNFTYFTPWANTTLDAERLMYFSPSWGPFSFYVFTEKRNERSVISGNNIADEDEDRYSGLVQYSTPMLYLGYALDWFHDRSSSQTPLIADPNGRWKADWYAHSICVKAADPSNTFFFEGEAQLQHGDYKDYYGSAADVKRRGWGAYATAGMKKGALGAGIATAFTSGDRDANDNKYKVGPASGADFQPLYILYGLETGILNGVRSDAALKAGYSNGSAYNAPDASATGSMGYWIYGDYVVDPKLALHAALGWARAHQVNEALYAKKDFGTELDLGLKYQIMNNLAYDLHFGYLWTGDFYKGTSAQNYQTENIYQLSHMLTLSF